jgi:hypothetical protein
MSLTEEAISAGGPAGLKAMGEWLLVVQHDVTGIPQSQQNTSEKLQQRRHSVLHLLSLSEKTHFGWNFAKSDNLIFIREEM